MSHREIERTLLAFGFKLARNGKRHVIWERDGVRVAVSHGYKTAPRTLKSMHSLLKRLSQNQPTGRFRHGT